MWLTLPHRKHKQCVVGMEHIVVCLISYSSGSRHATCRDIRPGKRQLSMRHFKTLLNIQWSKPNVGKSKWPAICNRNQTIKTEIKLHLYEQGDVTIQCQYRMELKCVTSSSFYFYFSHMYVICNAFLWLHKTNSITLRNQKKLKMGLKSSTLLHKPWYTDRPFDIRILK